MPQRQPMPPRNDPSDHRDSSVSVTDRSRWHQTDEHGVSLVQATRYTHDQLAEIYNAARVDYIVPMPMNGKRMLEYVTNYDIDLDASTVALNADRLEAGICMTGIRDVRAWATRLGVIPARRGHKIGQRLMSALIDEARARQLKLVQLEVIKGNEPAYRLFKKLGFEETRNLMIIRRPPGKPPIELNPGTESIVPIEGVAIPDFLAKREPGTAWTEETRSLIHAGNLRGFQFTLKSGEQGWIVFQHTMFQLTHFVLSADASPEMAEAALYHVHSQHFMQDTKIENLPSTSPLWPSFQKMGYLEVFDRIEMILTL